MTEPVRWGILGAGRISTVAVGPALAASPRCRVVAVGARDRDRAAELAGELAGRHGEPPARSYAGYEAVLSDPEVEAVYVALPNDAHVPWAVEAVRAGQHVLCEKPLGLDRAQAGAAFDAGEAAGRLVVEAAWNRWHPRTRDAERLVADGAVGRVVTVDAGFVFSGVPAEDYRMDPARGGGALYDVGCYALASVGWATGWAALSAVRPDIRRHGGGVDLMTAARLELGAASARIRAAIDEPPAQWLEITGTAGSLRLTAPAFTAWRDGPAGLEVEGPDGQVRSTAYPPCDPYRLMVEAVADRVRGGSSWLVPREQSEWVAAAVDALRNGTTGSG